jgi:hypothetical protein
MLLTPLAKYFPMAKHSPTNMQMDAFLPCIIITKCKSTIKKMMIWGLKDHGQ